MTTQEKAQAAVEATIMEWLDDKYIYMSPRKKHELVRLILRIVDETYADGYYDGGQRGRYQN